jgi:biopolymer transport protein TolR
MIVTLAVGERGMNLTTSTGLAFEIPLDAAASVVKQDYKALSEKLKQLRADFPDAAAITVSAEDTVPYGDLIEVIDTCVGQGLTAVSVSGV